MALSTYNFTVKGVTPEGTRVTVKGRLNAEEGYPMKAFDQAKACVEKQMPGIIIFTDNGGVVLQKLKKFYPKLYEPRRA